MIELQIDPEFSTQIPSLTVTEQEGLEKSLLAEGVLYPLLVWNGLLVDGHHRYALCQKHHLPYEVKELPFKDRTDVLLWITDQALHQRNLSPYQKIELALGKESLIQAVAEAKTNQRTSSGGSHPQLLQNSAEAESIDIRKQVAKIAHLSHDTIHKAKVIQQKADEETKEKLRAGDTSIHKEYRKIKETEKKKEIEGIQNQSTETLSGLYDVIVIDPPWPMHKIPRDVRPNQTLLDYPTMTLAEIENLTIPANEDCHLFLWTTQRFLPYAFELLKKWDFSYLCTFVWHKPGGFQPIRLPQYNCEFVLYARQGKPAFVDTKAFSTCFSLARGRHSEKPEGFYKMIRRVTQGRRLDMFNRRRLDGFEGWGKETK